MVIRFCKFIHWDVTTGADTWRDEAVNRYQQQQQQQQMSYLSYPKFCLQSLLLLRTVDLTLMVTTGLHMACAVWKQY